MRHFDLCVSIIGGMAAALVSMDANASGPFVDVRSVDPTITVELRYAGQTNFLGQPLYPLGTRALARPEVASALAVAQSVLRRYQYGLKIWDAYRPAAVQAKLWQALRNSDYVTNPEIAVGSTLVDSRNRDVRMPTDFDEFIPAAMEPYMGSSFEIGGRARLLKYAMNKAGFRGLRTEWWHFTIADWQKYLPPEKAKSAEQVSH